jgi:hypothetical protein
MSPVEEVFSAPEVAKVGVASTQALLEWVGYQRGLLISARAQLLLVPQKPNIRNMVARIDLALEGKRATP